jgi:hypothetical protein
MSERKRKIFTGAQKAKVALEAVKGMKTINDKYTYIKKPAKCSQSS